MTRGRKIALSASVALAVLCLAAVISGVLVVRSSWFREKVRARIVEEVERATGGRVELAAFHFDWRRLTASVDGFVLHGTEPPKEKPLLTAPKIEVGLRVISAMKRDIDIASVRVEKPHFNLLLDEDNNTNIPSPKLKSKNNKTILENLLRAKIGRVEIVDGGFHLLDNVTPLNLLAEEVKIDLNYRPVLPRYEGKFSTGKINLAVHGLPSVAVAAEATIVLEKNRVLAPDVRVKTAHSTAEAAFELDDLRNPKIEVKGKASAETRELVDVFHLPLERRGTVTAQGIFRWDKVNRYSYRGDIGGKGLALNRGMWRLNEAQFTATARVASGEAEFQRVRLKANEGEFDGSFSLKGWNRFSADGKIVRFPLSEVARMLQKPGLVWQAQIEGPVRVQGVVNNGAVSGLQSSGRLVISRQENEHPIDGVFDFEFDQRRERLVLHDSRVVFPSSQINVDGSLGERLNIEVQSSNLNDLTPALRLFGSEVPEPLPLALRNGSIHFRGTASGKLSDPRIAGHLAATRVEIEKHLIDQAESDVAAGPSSVSVRNLAVRQGETELRANAQLALSNWRPEDRSVLSATFALEKAKIGALLKESGSSAPVDGVASAKGTVKGTLGAPDAEFHLQVDRPILWERQLQKMSGTIRLTKTSVGVTSGSATLNDTTVQLEGAFDHPAGDWRSGQVRFSASSPAVALAEWKPLTGNLPELKGSLSVRAKGSAELKNGEFLLTSLNGTALSKNLTLRGKPLGRVSMEANSNGRQLQARATVQLSASKLTGEAQMELAGDYPVKGIARIEPLSFLNLQDLLGPEQNGKSPPFTGSLEGAVEFSGPARYPAKITGNGTITKLELKPRTVVDPNAKQPALDLTLRNDGPVRMSYKDRTIRVDAAKFVAKDTNLALDGTFTPDAKTPWDLRFKGSLNLAILQTFSTDLRVTGLSLMDATVRGTLTRPALSGRLELKNASVFMAGVPNGIDNANGGLVFDQNRVLIQEIKAQSGGGDLTLRGFLGLGGKELTFRLQGNATNVRVRYPEGVSTTLNADLNFTGTPAKSLLSGTATVVRSGLNAKTDMGGLFAASAKPSAEPVTTSDFLRGLKFDVAVNTVPSFQLATSYTKNLQTEARLQLRGTAAKPALTGRIDVSEGEIDFFGSTYRVQRGEINFYNPVTIEPVLDADLETRVRAITVNIKLSGTLTRMNISYRSDPPLSSSEILALLTAGRSPDMGQVTGTAIATPGDVSGSSTGTALLGQVLSTSVSGRLQKFFGVSRLKIDPRAVGLDGTPQAQLTVEQQISRNVTLTYVSNLQNTQQQIVRVEWNVSKQWSAVAVRDANGLFGIDFYYKKRLK